MHEYRGVIFGYIRLLILRKNSTMYRIDNQHSNAYAAWCELGSPQDPSPEQLEVIRGRESLEMVESLKSMEIGQNGFRKRFRLPMHGAMLLKIEASV